MARLGNFGNVIDEPGDYDEESSALQRRRMQLLNAMNTPIGDAYSGWGGGIANFLQNAIGNAQLQGLDKQSKDLAKRRDEFAQNALTQLGQLDKPAVPASPGVNDMPALGADEMGPAAPTAPTRMEPAIEGGGMIPTNNFAPATPAQPMIPGSMTDRAKLLSQMAQGGPMYQAIARHTMTTALEAPEKARVAAQAALDKKDAYERKAADDQYAASIKASDRQFERDRDATAKAEREAAAQAARAQQSRDHDERMAAIRASRPAAVEHTTLQGYDVATGRPVNRAPNGSLVRIGEDGRPEATPFTGETIPVAAKEKEIAAVRSAMVHKAGVENLLRMAETNEGAFGSSGALLGVIPGPAGTWISSANLTPEQRKARSDFATEAARITHDLYGSAFTTGEQGRAKQFIVDALDPPEVVLSKMQSMKQAADRSELFQSNVAKNAVRARMGGGAPAGGGGKTVTRTGTRSDGKKVIEYSDGTREVK